MSENEAFEGTAGAHAGRYAFDTRLEQTFESESEASGVGFTYRTPAALPDVADGASEFGRGCADAAVRDRQSISGGARGKIGGGWVGSPRRRPCRVSVSPPQERRGRRREPRRRWQRLRSPSLPLSSPDRISLCPPLPSPVTLAASIATAATAGLVSEVENRRSGRGCGDDAVTAPETKVDSAGGEHPDSPSPRRSFPRPTSTSTWVDWKDPSPPSASVDPWTQSDPWARALGSRSTPTARRIPSGDGWRG